MSDTEVSRVVQASRIIGAPADVIFEHIADPARQPAWDGNDNLAEAPDGQRVRGVGDVFSMTLTQGAVRENHVVEFEEGRRIGWRHFGRHVWRYELEPVAEGTRVTETFDWSGALAPQVLERLGVPARNARAMERTLERLPALVA